MDRRSFLMTLAGAPLAARLAAADADRDRGARRLRRAFQASFERPRVPPAAAAGSVDTKGGLVYEKLTVATEAGQRAPLLVVRPESGGRRPAILALHGLGGRKEGMTAYLEEFARRGFLAAGMDHRYHGDRAGDLQAVMAETFRTGREHPYLYDTVWDAWRVLDYLQARPDCVPDRFGVMGISLGGHATWMISADPRVAVAAPCISVCSWRWQLAHQGYTQRVKNLSRAFERLLKQRGEREVTPRLVAEAWERWMPGIPSRWDAQDLLAAFAPRPLLCLNGETDPVAPLPGVLQAWSVIEGAYARAGASDRARLMLEPVGHTVTKAHQAALYDWFERWLR